MLKKKEYYYAQPFNKRIKSLHDGKRSMLSHI